MTKQLDAGVVSEVMRMVSLGLSYREIARRVGCSAHGVVNVFMRERAAVAGKKAFVVNRVGDFGFALGIFAVFMMTGAVDFDTVFVQPMGLDGTSAVVVVAPPVAAVPDVAVASPPPREAAAGSVMARSFRQVIDS